MKTRICLGLLLAIPATALGSGPSADPLMQVARAEIAASNRHDLAAFLRAFTSDAVILSDASPYLHRDRAGLIEFFKHSALGSRVRYTVKPGAPQTEDRVGNRAYLEMVVNVHVSDEKGDSFNDPIHWIGIFVRQGSTWKIAGLTLTTAGG